MNTVQIIIFIVIAVALIGGGVWYNNRLSLDTQDGAVVEDGQTKEVVLEGGLKIEDVVVGDGEEVRNGDVAIMHYEGTLTDGTKFDSSYDRGEQFSFVLGAGQVIKGWDMGILGMKIGGKRLLTIPPEFGYGASGAGPIPPNATLKFTVELLGIGRS